MSQCIMSYEIETAHEILYVSKNLKGHMKQWVMSYEMKDCKYHKNKLPKILNLDKSFKKL